MVDRHLFLFGGGPPFNNTLGYEFAQYSQGPQGKVAVLFIKRDGWESYMQKYTSVLRTYGIHQFAYVPICSRPDRTMLDTLNSCTGVIISGGDTERYHTYIVGTDIGEQIIRMYNNGVPIAGFSAGALISPRNCVIPPIDNVHNEHLFLKGLGLIQDCVISVHFSSWNEEENLLAAMDRLDVSVGYGIDDDGGLYMENEQFIDYKSNNVHIFKRNN